MGFSVQIVFLDLLKLFQKGAAFGSQPVAHNPHLHPKYVLDYLYNGACILIELKRFEDALFLLEICVGMPAFSVQDQHLDSFKKYFLCKNFCEKKRKYLRIFLFTSQKN